MRQNAPGCTKTSLDALRRWLEQARSHPPTKQAVMDTDLYTLAFPFAFQTS